MPEARPRCCRTRHQRQGTGLIVNPVEKGHIAYCCDDIDAFKAYLEAKGVPYSDWGERAVNGWRQIFFYVTVGNVIEVHPVEEEGSPST